MGRTLAILLTTILLFGCGDDKKSSEPPATMPETGSTEGIVLSENAALSISNSYLLVQAVPGLPPVESTLETDCEGPTCTLTEPNTGISEPVSLQDIQDTDTSDIENLRQAAKLILTRNGVPVYGGSVTFALGEDSTVSATAYGGWMVHNFFLAAWGNYSGPNIPSAGFGTGLSVGNATGTHPAADATYSGVMLGVITAEGGAGGTAWKETRRSSSGRRIPEALRWTFPSRTSRTEKRVARFPTSHGTILPFAPTVLSTWGISTDFSTGRITKKWAGPSIRTMSPALSGPLKILPNNREGISQST